jgi:hypothetical protein
MCFDCAIVVARVVFLNSLDIAVQVFSDIDKFNEATLGRWISCEDKRARRFQRMIAVVCVERCYLGRSMVRVIVGELCFIE